MKSNSDRRLHFITAHAAAGTKDVGCGDAYLVSKVSGEPAGGGGSVKPGFILREPRVPQPRSGVTRLSVDFTSLPNVPQVGRSRR